jgi:uncharacterized protein (TIRG00374 family)
MIAVPLVGAAISLIAIALAIRGIDLSRTVEILTAVRPWPLAIVAIALVVQLWVRSLRWAQLLPGGPAGRIPTRRLVPVVLVGYLGNAVLPARLGDPIRALLVGRRESVAASSAFGSVVLERVIDTLMLALIVVPATVLSGGPGQLVGAAAIAASLAGLVLIVAQTSLPMRLVVRLQSRTGERGTAVLESVARFVAALDARGRARAVAAVAGLSVVGWLLDGTIYWAAGLALGIDLSLAGAMLVSAITVLGTAIPSAPGYVGTFELAATTVAIALGVPAEQALAFAILVHALTVLSLAVGGAISLVWMGARFSELASTAGMSAERSGTAVR